MVVVAVSVYFPFLHLVDHLQKNTLKSLNPSRRGEIELPQALSLGLRTMNWKIRVLKMRTDQFRGDLGNLDVYEKLKADRNWIRNLKP